VLLVYTGHEKLILTLNTSQLIAMFILVIPATYLFGITGTAITTAFIMIINSFVLVYLIRKKLGLRSWIMR